MSAASPRPALPLWLRLLALAAIVAWIILSRRNSELPQPVQPHPTPKVSNSAPSHMRTADRTDRSNKSPANAVPAPSKTVRFHDSEPDQPERSAADDRWVLRDLKLRDQSGRVIYQGEIDLGPTVERIAAGERLERFPHDGSTFQNRERRLPKQPAGYYREFVVPTPGEHGPGPQRLVVGKAGEMFYTSDHYQTFRRLK